MLACSCKRNATFTIHVERLSRFKRPRQKRILHRFVLDVSGKDVRPRSTRSSSL